LSTNWLQQVGRGGKEWREWMDREEGRRRGRREEVV